MSTIEDFPDVKYTTAEGLLALGGDLSPERLLSAYQKGIFPWFNPGESILWWSPDPRCVIFPDKYKPAKSLLKSIKTHDFRFSFDCAFDQVIHQCAQPRAKQPGTWISPDMIAAYTQLHELGYAHSVETWKNNTLVGGLYGIALGKIFFGESMFYTITDASKSALYYLISTLTRWNYQLIDCQVTSPHLLSLGAEEIPRSTFLDHLDCALSMTENPHNWKDCQTTSKVKLHS